MTAVLKIEVPGLRGMHLYSPAPALDCHQSAVSQRVHRTPLTRALRVEHLTGREPCEECPLSLVQRRPAMHGPSPHRALAARNGSYE
jgi:hypothetical protein